MCIVVWQFTLELFDFPLKILVFFFTKTSKIFFNISSLTMSILSFIGFSYYNYCKIIVNFLSVHLQIQLNSIEKLTAVCDAIID
jgi:hypothetical protein